jgi:3-oxoadipate enol-lactonase
MRIVAGDIVTHYRLEGPADAPVVTLSHSLAASLEMWEPQLPALTRRFRVLRYDTRGHGGSEVPPGAYTMSMLAGDLRSLLEALEIARTHFVGISMGGMIGQTLALEHPEVLDRLVLVDTASRMPPEAGPLWDERIAQVERHGLAPRVEETIERWFTPPFIAGSPDVVDHIRGLIRTTAPQGFIGCGRAIQALQLTDRLGEIEAPTLVIVGEKDMGTPVAFSELMHERIRGSKLVVLESAAHLSNVEQAERFNQVVTEFLEGATDRAGDRHE